MKTASGESLNGYSRGCEHDTLDGLLDTLPAYTL